MFILPLTFSYSIFPTGCILLILLVLRGAFNAIASAIGFLQDPFVLGFAVAIIGIGIYERTRKRRKKRR